MMSTTSSRQIQCTLKLAQEEKKPLLKTSLNVECKQESYLSNLSQQIRVLQKETNAILTTYFTEYKPSSNGQDLDNKVEEALEEEDDDDEDDNFPVSKKARS